MESPPKHENLETWKCLWNMKVLEKIKTFMWRVENNLLATKQNMFIKKCVDNPLCPICLTKVETVIHALWQCLTANDIWSTNSSLVKKWKMGEEDLLTMWGNLRTKMDMPQSEWMATTMRSIWHRWSEYVFENKLSNPFRVSQAFNEMLTNFKLAREEEK